MDVRTGECGCGAVTVACEGEPVRVSVCHCRNCKRRTGGAFSVQARWPEAQVTLSGETRSWERIGDEGRKAVFRFCPACGSTMAYVIDALPGLVAIPMGAFADENFTPWPSYSVYENRKHGWVEITGDVEHD